ncbi:hypothetical protein [uncultured Maricaulis sp.]|uniref:hypothetical protein n=1 Tax=uncultured Maricaulis sp. TaxID=174710 RepID=UPI00260BD559|nr:hypothetical protein [uncultured Maricaulis sp.]
MWRWLTNNHQTLTGVGAMLVGVAALFVAWDQGRVMRAQQHGAVVPVLQIDGFIQSTPEFRNLGLRIVNNGVGPAMIRSVSLYRDGEAVDGFQALTDLMPDGYDRSWSSVNGRALAPGGEVEPGVFTWPHGAMSAAELGTLLGEWQVWSVEVCYCSVFDRCWISSSENQMREAVPACPTATLDPFESLATAGWAQTMPEADE